MIGRVTYHVIEFPIPRKLRSAQWGVFKAKLTLGRVMCLPEMGLYSIALRANSLARSSHREIWLQGKHDGESRDSSWYSQLVLFRIAGDLSRFARITVS